MKKSGKKKGVKIVKEKESCNARETCVLEVKKFFDGALLPAYAMESDVGIDLRSWESAVLRPMEQKAIRTGIAIKIPEGHVGLIRDRAGIVSKMNVHTAAGTFDPAYRGEISIVLINFSDDTVQIEKGMRIAQLIIIPVTKVKVTEVKKLDITERYDKGFGSTGIKELLKLEKQMNIPEHDSEED